MRCLAIMNQKGGVGKTTTTINLSHALAEQGYKVVVIDLDPQSHLGLGMGFNATAKEGLDTIFFNAAALDDVVLPVEDRLGLNKLSLVVAGERLGEVEAGLKGGAERGWLVKNAISESEQCQKSDFVLMDCPPSAGLLGMNALFAADELLIPVSSDFLSLHGASRMVGIIDYIDESMKQKSKKWFVITRYHGRRKLSQEVKEKLMEYFKSEVLATPVRESVALAESPSYGQSIFDYQPKSNGAEDYRQLAEDLLYERVM
ncbi:MAG: ParA family protein [Gammaproteobacteria bacterium]|nr:ParA family protein [Gammaproteobacteria bacterium]